MSNAHSTDDLCDTVSKAMRKAWQLGQTYWQQADSESLSQHKKADITQQKFDTLMEETRLFISTPSPAWCASVDAELAATEEADALVSPSLGPWNPIGTAPKNQKLIVGYRNKLGNWRTVMARHYPPLTLLRGEEVEWDDDDIESAYAPPGWYEEVESHETIRLTDRVPTHWMYLPGEPVTPAITLPATAVAEGLERDGESLEPGESS